MQSILGILYLLSQMQNYALFLLNAKFLPLVHAEFLFMNNTACKI